MLGIEWCLNAEIATIDETGVRLKDGSHIASSTVVWTAGVQANALTEQFTAERDHQGRLYVDENLRIRGVPAVYATGDVVNAASDDVGNNVAASVMGLPPIPYRQVNYVTCLDLGGWGAVYTEGWDQKVQFVREEAKKIKIAITNELIYPPKAEREIAFAAADPVAKFV